MSEFVTAAVEWATNPGPPNWVFVLALLTTPAYWSDKVRKWVGRLIDKRFGGGE